MNKACIFIFFILTCHFADAQVKNRFRVELTAGPAFANRSLSSFSTDSICQGCKVTYTQLVDSVNQTDGFKTSATIGAGFIYVVNENLSVQTGLRYNNIGFSRKLNDLQFKDKIYPGVGAVTEITTQEKTAIFNYRFHYLSIPLLAQYRINTRKKDKLVFFITVGTGFDFFMSDDISIKLDGFAINAKSKFKSDSTGFTHKPFNNFLIGGGRMEYRISEQFSLGIAPEMRFPLFHTTSGAQRMKPYAIALQAALVVDLIKPAKKE
jgi:hypothetical protein